MPPKRKRNAHNVEESETAPLASSPPISKEISSLQKKVAVLRSLYLRLGENESVRDDDAILGEIARCCRDIFGLLLAAGQPKYPQLSSPIDQLLSLSQSLTSQNFPDITSQMTQPCLAVLREISLLPPASSSSLPDLTPSTSTSASFGPGEGKSKTSVAVYFQDGLRMFENVKPSLEDYLHLNLLPIQSAEDSGAPLVFYVMMANGRFVANLDNSQLVKFNSKKVVILAITSALASHAASIFEESYTQDGNVYDVFQLFHHERTGFIQPENEFVLSKLSSFLREN